MAASTAHAQQTDEQLAAYYFDRGDYAQASQLYESLYKRGQQKYHYQRLLATYLELEQYRDAQRLVERQQKRDSKDLTLYVDEGRILLHQGQKKKAEKCFEKAIEHVTSNLQPVPDLALAFSNIGRYDLAASTYLAARMQTQNSALYFSELTATYQQAGNYAAMTEEYFNLLDTEPRMLPSVQLAMQRDLEHAPDTRLADGVRRALVSRIQEHPENRTYLEMMTWFSLQQRDFRFALDQAEAVDARFPEGGGDQVLRVAQIAQNNEAYDVAADAYSFLQHKGPGSPHYYEARTGELAVEYTRLTSSNNADSKSFSSLRKKYSDVLSELGKNERTIPLMRQYAQLEAYHDGDVQEAVSALDDILEMKRLRPQTRDEVKLELGDLLLFAGEVWDASLLYSQVEKANSNDLLGAEAKFRNAKLSYYNHDFPWAKSQLEVLRASTSKLIANDAMELSLLISDNMEADSTYTTLALFADADLQLYRNQLEAAWKGYDAVARASLSHPLHDEVLLRKALIRTRQGRFQEADSLLQRLVDLYPTDITADDALWQMAQLNETPLHNIEKARACYERLLIDYPSSLYCDRARKRFNALKTK